MKQHAQWMVLLLLVVLAACDPMAPQATPVAVIVSPLPTLSPTPAVTDTPTPTVTPIPTATPDFTPTPTPFPCDEDSGQIVEVDDFRSETAGGENLRYDVYLPPCYQELQVRYPYVILLHGLSYSEEHWQEIGVVEALDQGIRLGALPPMMLVMPYYGNFGQINQFPPEPSYETVILEELMPAVEQDFCTINNRENRAIGGISRGGFWAYSVGMRHPDVFSILGGHSAFFPESEFEVPAPFNPIEIARNSSLLPEANLRMYLDNGAGDSASLSQKSLSDELELRSIPHSYVINVNGEHNNEYWSAHVSEYLAFYGRNWSRSYTDLPSCLEPSP